MTRREPTQYDWTKVRFDETILADIDGYPRRQRSRDGHAIEFLVIHHMAMVGRGDGSANDACIRTWRQREASAHYGVDGPHVRQFVWDSMAAWGAGNLAANVRSISIEHANSTGSPSWKVSDDTLKTGARLAAYLCHVYKLGRPEWGTTLRRHGEFTQTACPGPYLGSAAADEYEAEAQRIYDLLAAPEPPPEPPEDPMFTYPAEVLGPHFQKVTLPVDGPDSGSAADEIVPPRWLTYTSKYLRIASDGEKLVFTVWHGGATTPNSDNPRCEGRETWTDGRLAKWDGRKGEHGLRAVMTVDKLTPVKPHDVLLQIHNGSGDVATIRAEGVKDSDGELTDRVKLYGSAGNSSHHAYLGDVKRTQRFTIALEVEGGRIYFVLNGKRHAKSVAATADCYFKLGLYLQSNPDTAEGETTRSFSRVRLFSEPDVWHRSAA